MRRLLPLLVLLIASSGTAHAEYDGRCTTLDDVMALPAGHFCEVESSHLRAVERAPEDYPDFDGTHSASYESYQRNAGVGAVIHNWSGGAFDARRDRLLVFGGGHNGYGGNELYAFSLRTLTWERVTDPTVDPNRCATENDDGTPTSRHTYDGLAYIAHADRLFVLGGAWDCASGGAGARGTWTFDLASPGASAPWGWERRSREGEPDTGVEDNAVYDPVTGRVFYDFGSSPSGMSSYDFDTDSWTEHNRIGGGYQRSLVIAGSRRIIVELGGGDPMVFWDLDDPALAPTEVATAGATAMENEGNPGIAYDTRADRIVAWKGGTTVYSFDVDAREWARHDAPTTNRADPGGIDAVGGVYGRFAYSQNLNVYVMVDSVDENVFLYRFAPGSGVVPPDPPPAEPPEDGGTGEAPAVDAAAPPAADAGTASGSDPEADPEAAVVTSGCAAAGRGSAAPHAAMLALLILMLRRLRRR